MRFVEGNNDVLVFKPSEHFMSHKFLSPVERVQFHKPRLLQLQPVTREPLVSLCCDERPDRPVDWKVH